MIVQDTLQVGDADCDRHIAEPEEDDTGMGMAVAEDQVSEILVISDEDTLFLFGNCQDPLVRERVWMISSDGGNVVSLLDQIGGKAKRNALIKQESHPVG